MARSMMKDLTEGKPLKLVLSFAFPLLFGVLFQQLYSFVDTAIVGRYLGAEKLASVGATGSVNFLVIGLCLGFCSGFSIPIAQAFGAKDEHEMRRCVFHAVVLSGVLSILFAVLSTVLQAVRKVISLLRQQFKREYSACFPDRNAMKIFISVKSKPCDSLTGYCRPLYASSSV